METISVLYYLGAGLVFLYLFGIALFLILDNRSPQSTFAWLFLFVIFPIGGVIIYIFFGRNRKTFSQESNLTKHKLSADVYQALQPLLTRQEAYIHKLEQEKPKSYKKKLLHLVANYSILTGYNEVEILQNASEKYPRLMEDIRQAQHSVHLLYYIWADDDLTHQFKEILIERAKAGVKVRCLYDATGGSLSKNYIRELQEAGVSIHPYLAIDSLYKIHSINYRSHRKIAVIDGRIGYIGGLNLEQKQLDGGEKFNFWRDTHLRITGEAVHPLQASFCISWSNTTKEKITDSVYYPPTHEEMETFVPVQITFSGPDSEWAAVRQLYFSMILAAKEKVYIQSPFFIPDPSIIEALKATALAGVDVKMMFAPTGPTYRIPYWAANTYFVDIARAGVQVFLYQKGYFHPKTVNIDAVVCSVGTANLDIRSFSLNYEANAVIYDEEKAQELEQAFLEDLKHCTEFQWEEYEQRHILLRLRDSLARLASPLL